MDIRINQDPPLAAVLIVDEAAKGISTIEKVLFDTFFFEECTPSAYCPQEHMIIIDLGHCLMSPYFIRQGMMFYPGIWFNVLWSFHHEVYHAKQLEADPSLADWEGLPPSLEGEADQYTANKVMDWCANGGQIPKINEMGWMGDQVKALINAHYHDETGDKLIRQLEATRLNAVAEFRDVVTLKDMQMEISLAMLDDILAGKMGIVKDNMSYLTSTEFFGASFCTMGKYGERCIYEAPVQRLMTESAGGML